MGGGRSANLMGAGIFLNLYGAEFYTPPPPTPESALLGVGGGYDTGGVGV